MDLSANSTSEMSSNMTEAMGDAMLAMLEEAMREANQTLSNETAVDHDTN